jgi:hypothetical protein
MTENDILKRLNDMTVPSDNTQVVSPYRIKARTESAPDITKVDRRQQVLRFREIARK